MSGADPERTPAETSQDNTGAIDLMTDHEAAKVLRCSAEKVKRLRLAQKIAYLEGRPPLIPRSELIDYIKRATRPAVVGSEPSNKADGQVSPEKAAAVEKQVRTILLQRQFASMRRK